MTTELPLRQYSRLRMPINEDLNVNVSFDGSAPLTKEAIDAVIRYLELWKRGLHDEADPQPAASADVAAGDK